MSVSKRIEGVLLIRDWPDHPTEITYWCPGCGGGHTVEVSEDASATWTWNGSTTAPTFQPSVLANHLRGNASEEWLAKHPRCHSFVTDGKIRYLEDSGHPSAGQTVDMVPLPERYAKFLDH